MDPEDIKEIERTLDNARSKLDDVKNERDELFEANKKLVHLVKKLENALEESVDGKIRFDNNEYSFEGGWMPSDIIHEEDLELEEPKIDEIDKQISEIIKTMRETSDLNSTE